MKAFSRLKKTSTCLLPAIGTIFLFCTFAAEFSFSEEADLFSDFAKVGDNKALLEKARALNPGERIEVVQDRSVNRFQRWEFAPEYSGVLGGDNFLVTRVLSMNVHRHFSPSWGIGVKASTMNNRLSQDGENLLADTQLALTRSMVPDIDYPKNQFLIMLNAYPIYGKLNFFNSGIVQFDLYGLLGVGQINLASGTKSTWTGGIGAGFWLSQHLTARLEMRYQNYKAQRSLGIYNVDLSVASASIGYLL